MLTPLRLNISHWNGLHRQVFQRLGGWICGTIQAQMSEDKINGFFASVWMRYGIEWNNYFTFKIGDTDIDIHDYLGRICVPGSLQDDGELEVIGPLSADFIDGLNYLTELVG